MFALARGDRRHPRPAEVQGNAAGALERAAIKLDDRGAAGPGKPAVGNDDVDPLAGSGQIVQRHRNRPARQQEPPGPATAGDLQRAEVGIAARVGPGFEREGIAIHAGHFGQLVARESAAALAQDDQLAGH